MSQYQAYPFAINEEETHYKFQSIGKRGIFDKAISFTEISANVYNLALMDYSPAKQDYVDDTITDNGDLPEVMATVLAVILKYLEDYPGRSILLTGNSTSRNRLYQISISKVIGDLEGQLTIYGYRNGKWYPFESNGSFNSFLIERK